MATIQGSGLTHPQPPEVSSRAWWHHRRCPHLFQGSSGGSGPMLAAPNLLFAGDGPGVVAWSWASCSSTGWTRCPPEVPLDLSHPLILGWVSPCLTETGTSDTFCFPVGLLPPKPGSDAFSTFVDAQHFQLVTVLCSSSTLEWLFLRDLMGFLITGC